MYRQGQMFGGQKKMLQWAFWKFLSFHEFLLSIMEAGDDYVEVPILLQKKNANSAATTQCTNSW